MIKRILLEEAADNDISISTLISRNGKVKPDTERIVKITVNSRRLEAIKRVLETVYKEAGYTVAG